jgi:ornithine carbamoyltransferase
MIHSSVPKGAKQSPFNGHHFLKLSDFKPDFVHDLLREALHLKQLQYKRVPHPYLSGKVLGMIFEKASTRTRVSFEVGMVQLGGHAVFLSKNDMQLNRGESMEDTARVLSRYVDGVMIRTHAHEVLESFAEHADVPVINGLTDKHHPAQVLADLLTVWERCGGITGRVLTYLGDTGNNMAHSYLLAGATARDGACRGAGPHAVAHRRRQMGRPLRPEPPLRLLDPSVFGSSVLPRGNRPPR